MLYLHIYSFSIVAINNNHINKKQLLNQISPAKEGIQEFPYWKPVEGSELVESYKGGG